MIVIRSCIKKKSNIKTNQLHVYVLMVSETKFQMEISRLTYNMQVVYQQETAFIKFVYN